MRNPRVGCVVGGFLSLVLSLSAQTFTTLHSFDDTDGFEPYAGLVQATNGSLYGATVTGGGGGRGTVFKITTSGKLTTLYTFCHCYDYGPIAVLVQATNGNLYGTIPGGLYDDGWVFEITLGGKLTTLHSFDGTDGAAPIAALIQATNGDLYGTTSSGGASGKGCGGFGCGTIFKTTPSGKLTTLYSFGGTDGANPAAALVQDTNGNFYGTTPNGGAYGAGTILQICPRGRMSTLYSFGGTDGANPAAALVQDTNGNFYGTTPNGGAYGAGTIFQITPSGKLTTLHSFDGTDGAAPIAALIQATNGDLYGTTSNGGSGSCTYGCGTVFKITLSGKLTTLHGFGGTDGTNPAAALVQDTNGNFYGTTPSGGGYGAGTVFSLSVGLGPFVETQPTSGKVGAAVKILGTDLKGTTSVTFNGTAAKFTVVSKSEIKTTVPKGATTGKVKVKTPKGTLKSNVVFRVK